MPDPATGVTLGATRAAARASLAAAFREAGIDSPEIDARLLLCAAANIGHTDLIGDPERILEPEAAARLSRFAARRLRREPVSRILGRREFWSLSFGLDGSVLDPRPETEGLVASVIDAAGGRRRAPLRVLDLGTGSGAILGALLSEFPAAEGLAIDRSAAACRMARQNLEALGLARRAWVVCGDWARAVGGRFDIVASNPPYIETSAIAELALEVRAYDPSAALDGGMDGLDAFRAIVPALSSLLRPGGIAAFECGTGQGKVVAALLEGAGLGGSAVYRDLAGHDRVVLATASV